MPPLSILLQWNLWIADTYGSWKICPLLRGARYWEVIQKRLSHLGLNVLPAIEGMSAIGRFHYIYKTQYHSA